ncbi:phage minor head protein [Streptomyces sp. NPDC058469]|uniref:phage minor head protein n=1 Tax=Streptomyces sp. NPDC058469 TaxID=3346514 RepID=UPI00365B5271
MHSELLDARERLGVVIRASDDWEDDYRADPAAFKQLVKAERALERSVLTYLGGLADRVPALVQWHQLSIRAAADPQVIDPNDPRLQEEKTEFFRQMYDGIESLVLLGGLSGEYLYGVQLGLNPANTLILDAARSHTGTLIKEITATNLRLIRQSIGTSIELGEDGSATIDRVQKVIANPVRSEMIARTETVNAYQIGLEQFAHLTNAVSKTWQAKQAGACRVCAPLNDVTVAIDESFATLLGPRIRPTAHPRCRCGLRYNYK